MQLVHINTDLAVAYEEIKKEIINILTSSHTTGFVLVSYDADGVYKLRRGNLSAEQIAYMGELIKRSAFENEEILRND